jgi:hypothetical protein
MNDTPNYPVKFEDCQMQGGHCWERIIAAAQKLFPPPETCKHCGATRNYTEPEAPE